MRTQEAGLAALKRRYWRLLQGRGRLRDALIELRRPVVLRSYGWCPACAHDTTFVARGAGRIVHLDTPAFHRNPISDEGSLVTMDWGFDICRCVFDASVLFTHVVRIDDLSRGIRAEYIDVLITIKPHPEPAGS